MTFLVKTLDEQVNSYCFMGASWFGSLYSSNNFYVVLCLVVVVNWCCCFFVSDFVRCWPTTSGEASSVTCRVPAESFAQTAEHWWQNDGWLVLGMQLLPVSMCAVLCAFGT